MHAVSVGEIVSAVELIRKLREEYPRVEVFVSCTTLAGRDIADQKLDGIAAGVFFAPIDYRAAVRNVLRTIKPSLVLILETEIWPNLYRETVKSGSGLMVANARISDRAIPSYRRYSWFFREILQWPNVILAQSEKDRRRFIEVGAPANRVRVGGNLKYDFSPKQGEVPLAIAGFMQRSNPAQVWIAASTMPGAHSGDVDEDDVVIKTFTQLTPQFPGLMLLLVPRKPERFAIAAQKLADAGIPFVRRTAINAETRVGLPGVLLLDSIGELGSLFGFGDVIFMGGTLARRGGHNILEPASFGKPIIVGPHMENFTAIADEFLEGEALYSIANSEELTPAVARLLGDPALRQSLGEAANKLAEAKRGVTGIIAREALALHSLALPHSISTPLVLWTLWPLSRLWKWSVEKHRRRSTARKLKTRTISIGGLTMGGTGKTPMVQYLASKFHEIGLRPAILTRGYRRRSPNPIIVIPAGVPATIDMTGDEAQIFVRSGRAIVGIGGDRYQTGLVVEERETPGVFLLDDGYQHWKLTRDLDIVLIDSLDPFGGGWLFPLGRLREPMESLTRANIFVITRVEPGMRTDAIESELRRRNPTAPIFRSGVVPECWVENDFGVEWAPDRLPVRRIAAFCGLANPSSFWQTLRELGYDVICSWSFDDHHHFRPSEIRRMVNDAREHGAEALVTTEKDLMNLGPNITYLIEPTRLYWLKIGVSIERESEFLRAVGISPQNL